jgi:hypothetical protein
MRTRSLLPAALLLYGCSLHRRPAEPEPARGPARDSLFQLDQSRGDTIIRRGSIDGMLALLTPDVVYLRAGVPAVYGRSAARAVLAAGITAAATNVSWQPLGGGVSNDLLAAYTYGVAARVGEPRSPVRLERYIAFWRRARHQPWRIAAYAEVGSPPAATEIVLTNEQTTPPTPVLGKSVAEAAAAVRAADSLFADVAYRLGVPFAFSTAVAADGAVFGSPQLVVGPAAVQEFYDARGEASSLSWHPVFAASRQAVSG